MLIDRFRLTAAWLLPLALLAGCTASRTAAPDAPPSPYASDPSVVAVIAGEPLTLDEFESRYARTVGGEAAAAADSLGAYEDFLQRYVDFRLKVRAARDMGMDRDSTVRAEIAGYRTGLARPYLRDREILEPVMRTLYERQREAVAASHILIRVPPEAAPADTLAAWNRLAALRDSVAAGADFGDLAAAYSEDPSAKRPAGQPGSRGDLGYFSAGQMVGEFEDAAYATPVGSLSPIIRTQYGYHLLSVRDRIEKEPDVEIAHLMLVPEGPTREDSLRVYDTLSEIQDRLAAGEDFGALAREFSMDANSAQRGGLLGVLPSTQAMPEAPMFKEAAFAIEEEGTVSDIVVTPFGFHLLKLIDRKERESFDDAYDELKAVAARSPQAQAAEARMTRNTRAARGTTVDSAFVRATFADVPAEGLMQVFYDRAISADAAGRVFATLGDSSYTVRQLAVFARSNSIGRTGDTETLVFDLVDRFLNDRAIDYETAALEGRDPEFARIMQEFRDGLVLFKLMEDSVWTAAAQDTSVLRAHYEAHRAEYGWPDRTRIVGFVSAADSVLADVAAQLDGGATIADVARSYAADTLGLLRVDTTLIAGPTGGVFDRALALPLGGRTAPLTYAGRKVVFVRDGEEAARPKTFDEALPEVIGDYQSILEARLVARLRAEYGAETYPARLDRAFADWTPADDEASAASTDAPSSDG